MYCPSRGRICCATATLKNWDNNNRMGSNVLECAIAKKMNHLTIASKIYGSDLTDLSRPIEPRHLKTRKQGTATLTYCPWNTIARHLHHRAPGWCWEVQSVQEVGAAVVVTGRLTIPTADGDLLHYSAVASEPLESAFKAPAAEVTASSCLRRATALAGLGLELWG
jgi:hypothetical protein